MVLNRLVYWLLPNIFLPEVLTHFRNFFLLPLFYIIGVYFITGIDPPSLPDDSEKQLLK